MRVAVCSVFKLLLQPALSPTLPNSPTFRVSHWRIRAGKVSSSHYSIGAGIIPYVAFSCYGRWAVLVP